MSSRLVMTTLLVLIVILVFGWISIDSQFYALERTTDDSTTLRVAGARQQLAKPVVIDAELLPEGQEVVLMPQYQDVLVRNGDRVEPAEGSFSFRDGKLHYWGDTHPKRAWVFVVISEDKPKVTVEP